jgi:hypothetical protein
MTTAAVALTGEEALKLVAGAPDIADKSPSDLRDAAAELERQAMAKDRLLVGGGSRRGARNMAREARGERLRIQAQVISRAASEVEKRKCSTIGDAMKPGFVRALKRIGRS